MTKHAVFLEGPIGAGKTTLGRALAEQLQGHFIDGDDHSDPDGPWFCSSYRTSKRVLHAGLKALQKNRTIIVAYPLRRVNWIYFNRRFKEASVTPSFVSLSATYEEIVSERRGRVFSDTERARIRTMISQGYGRRPFSDLILQTGRHDLRQTLGHLEAEVRQLIGQKPSA